MLHMGHPGLWTPLEMQTPHMASAPVTVIMACVTTNFKGNAGSIHLFYSSPTN